MRAAAHLAGRRIVSENPVPTILTPRARGVSRSSKILPIFYKK